MRNTITRIVIIILCTISQNILGCINETRVLLNGKTKVFDEIIFLPIGVDYERFRDKYEVKLKELYKSWKDRNRIEDYSDYGAVLVYLGRYKEALKVFKEIESISPGRYETASNMGTVYELLGKNENAYKWIEKAIKIKPEAHDSSEWLHLKILEVKIKGNKYLKTNFLLGTNFGNKLIPESSLSNKQLNVLKFAIYSQLDERISFIKPPDPIVGLLLFELGNICAIVDDATSAYEIYQKASEYGYSSRLFDKRFKLVSDLQSKLTEKTYTAKMKIYRSDSAYKSDSINKIEEMKINKTPLPIKTIVPKALEAIDYWLYINISIVIALILSIFMFKMRKR